MRESEVARLLLKIGAAGRLLEERSVRTFTLTGLSAQLEAAAARAEEEARAIEWNKAPAEWGRKMGLE